MKRTIPAAASENTVSTLELIRAERALRKLLHETLRLVERDPECFRLHVNTRDAIKRAIAEAEV